jgi:hypothetical protein
MRTISYSLQDTYATHINLPVNFAVHVLSYSLTSVAVNRGRLTEVQIRLQHERGSVSPLQLTSL